MAIKSEYIPLGPEGQRIVGKRRRVARLRNLVCLGALLSSLLVGSFLFLNHGREAMSWTRFDGARKAAQGIYRGAGAIRPVNQRTVLAYKSGHPIIYERMPVQLVEERPDMPYRLVYSDVALRFGNIEVINVLENSTQLFQGDKEADHYRMLQDNKSMGITGNLEPMGWMLDRYKFVPMTTHAWRTHPGMSWYVFADDDTYFFWSTLLRWLDATYPAPDKTALYLGYDEQFDKDSGLYFAHGGAGYVLSGRLMEILHEDGGKALNDDSNFVTSFCGDCAMGVHISQLPGRKSGHLDGGGELFHHDGLDMVIFRPRLWHTYIVSLHHNSPGQLNNLRQWERDYLPTLPEWDGIRLCDVLFGLAPAFLREPLQAYVNASRGPDPATETAKLNRTVVQPDWALWPVDPLQCRWDCIKPYGDTVNAESCDRACDAHENCFSWHVVGDTCYLARDGFRLGAPSNDHDTLRVVGWRVDRIAALEMRMPCLHSGYRRLADEKGQGKRPGRADMVDTGRDRKWKFPTLPDA